MTQETTNTPSAEPVKDENAGLIDESRFTEPDYGSLVDEPTEDRGDVEPQAIEPPAQQPPAAAESPQTPESPPAEAVSSPSPVTAEPPAPVPAPPAQATPPAPAAPAAPPPDPAEIERQVIEALQARLAIPPEEAAQIDELGAKPSEYLPKLLARAYKDVFLNTFNGVMQQMTTQVETVLTERQKAQEAENAFFTRWPQLKGKDAAVMEAIKAYRAVNPQADVPTLIERAGALATLNLGLSPASQPEPPTPGVQAAAPSPLPPPRPALPGASGPGVSSSGPTKTYEEGIYEEMIRQEFNS